MKFIKPVFSIPIAIVILTVACSTFVFAADKKNKTVYKFDLKEEVTPGLARKFSKAIEAATTNHADVFLIHMNTYGGMLDAADSIRTDILNSTIPVIVYVDNNAASAGALISIACNRIYMRSGSSIGAATVVNESAQAMPDKYQSYMRSIMRSTAEKRGRDPKIAEAMVDPRTYIPGVNDTGKVLTFTATEAVKNNYCNGIAESVDEVLKAENISSYSLVEFKPSFLDNIICFLINPAISGILILIMLGGLYFEFQAPGTFFPIAASLVAAMLYFAPLYLEGLAANWEILVFIIGLILLAVEIFVIPGFGITGIAGIICIATGFILSMVSNNGFDFSHTSSDELMRAVISVVSSMMLTLVAIIYVGNKLVKTSRFNKLVLHTSMKSSKGFHSKTETMEMKGKQGTAVTSLRPSGKINIEGKVYSATAQAGFIVAGENVEVIEDGLMIVVRKL
jgi:membrane-bound serine protease (ClpP class)